MIPLIGGALTGGLHSLKGDNLGPWGASSLVAPFPPMVDRYGKGEGRVCPLMITDVLPGERMGRGGGGGGEEDYEGEIRSARDILDSSVLKASLILALSLQKCE